jgi:hypothetical protein
MFFEAHPMIYGNFSDDLLWHCIFDICITMTYQHSTPIIVYVVGYSGIICAGSSHYYHIISIISHDIITLSHSYFPLYSTTKSIFISQYYHFFVICGGIAISSLGETAVASKASIEAGCIAIMLYAMLVESLLSNIVVNQYTKINDQLQTYAWTGLFFMMVQRLWNIFFLKWCIIHNNIKQLCIMLLNQTTI